MSDREIATIKPLPIKGVRMVWPRRLAYRLDRLAVIEGRDLLMSFSLEDDRPRVREVRTIGYRACSMRLSPSRRFLVLGNEAGNWYEVRDADKLEPLSSVSAPERFQCGFASLAESDVLISAPRPGIIEVLSLPGMNLLARVRREVGRPFVVANLTAVGDGHRVAFVGHPSLGLYGTHLIVDTSLLHSGGQQLNDDLDATVSARGNLDVAVGPCGWDDVLVYEGSGTPAPTGGARGALSVRKLEGGAPVEEIACDRVLGPQNSMMGTSLAVAIAFDEGVLLLPRKDLPAEARFLPARASSFDPDAGRLARITPESTVELVELARS
jgi:hypothetical protein